MATDTAANVEIEAQGDHEFLVRLQGLAEEREAWVRLTPALLDEVGIPENDEPAVVRRTVEFLLTRQDASDFPAVVELEDVLAAYPEYRSSLAH